METTNAEPARTPIYGDPNGIPLSKMVKANVPTIRICGYCAKEFPKVDAAVSERAKVGDLLFNHGVCLDHAYEMYRANGIPEDKIKASLSRFKPETQPADLRKNVELRQQMEAGVFTQQDLAKSQQSQQVATSKMTERLKKLAVIIS